MTIKVSAEERRLRDRGWRVVYDDQMEAWWAISKPRGNGCVIIGPYSYRTMAVDIALERMRRLHVCPEERTSAGLGMPEDSPHAEAEAIVKRAMEEEEE